MIVKKVWGFEDVLVNSPLYCAKFLNINPNMKSSFHYHPIKDETFVLLKGDCNVSFGTGAQNYNEELKLGQSMHIPVGQPHLFSSVHGCTLLEVSTHHDDSDVIRLEPSGPCS